MNREKLVQLQDTLRGTDTYDQVKYFHDCGTPACIAGHAHALFVGEQFPIFDEDDALENIVSTLGIDTPEAQALFRAHPYRHGGPEWGIEEYVPTKHDAIAAIQSLLDTGKVTWPDPPKEEVAP